MRRLYLKREEGRKKSKKREERKSDTFLLSVGWSDGSEFKARVDFPEDLTSVPSSIAGGS